MSPRRQHAVTLFECLLVVAIVGIGYVGIARLTGHALRISERAQVRSELTVRALSELERLRVEATRHPDFRPESVRLDAANGVQIAVSHQASPEIHVMSIEVTVRTMRTEPPFEVGLTGWVAREAPSTELREDDQRSGPELRGDDERNGKERAP
jgi:Tfp pilus assembly protein PilV